MKILHYTHVDNDGYGSLVIFRRMFQELYNITPDYRIVNYDFENSLEVVDEIMKYDMIIFTDISFSRQFAIKLNKLAEYCSKKLILLDHHESAKSKLSDLDYPWIHIDTTKSGCMLSYEYAEERYETFRKLKIIDDSKLNKFKEYYEYAKLVNDYDLWIHKYPNSIKLQFLWSGMNKEEYIDKFTKSPKFELTHEQEQLVNDNYNAYLNSVNQIQTNHTIHTDCEGYTFAVTSKPLFYSLASTTYLKSVEGDVDYLVLVDGKSMSFRSLGLEVRKIAEQLGGGGHPTACGAPMNPLMDVPRTVINRKPVLYGFVDKFKNKL